MKGFVALTSSLIISFIFLVTAVSLGQKGIIARFAILDIENKEISKGHARACVEVARIALARNPDYEAVGISLTLPSGTCTFSVLKDTPRGGVYTLRAHASYQKAHTRLVLEIGRDGKIIKNNEGN